MHQRIISAENQTQRVNQIIQKMEDIQQLDFTSLTERPAEDRWSIIEVVGHMNAAYHLYRERLDQHIPGLPDLNEPSDTFKAGRKNAWFINMITPQGGKRSSKMKTTKKFHPVFQVEELDEQKVQEVFTQFFSDKQHLKGAIQASRTKKVGQSKFNSAIGPVVRFYLPEAFEFVIGHDERHLVQVGEVLAQVKT